MTFASAWARTLKKVQGPRVAEREVTGAQEEGQVSAPAQPGLTGPAFSTHVAQVACPRSRRDSYSHWVGEVAEAIVDAYSPGLQPTPDRSLTAASGPSPEHSGSLQGARCPSRSGHRPLLRAP